jgi:hypothetical protein
MPRLAVTGSIDGYQGVVAVVTAEHEHANQRLVVRRALRSRFGDEIDEIQTRRQPEGGHCADVAQESATTWIGICHVQRSTWY